MTALWGSLVGIVGAALSAAFFYFWVLPREVKKAADAAVQTDVLQDRIEADKREAAAVVTHGETEAKVVAIKTQLEKDSHEDPVALANALLRDSTGRRPR